MALSNKQQLFVQHYLATLNGTQAAISSGYSPRTARAIASENLKKPAIREAIKKGQSRARKRLDGIIRKTEQELVTIGFASMADGLADSGNLLPPGEWPKQFTDAVQEYKQTISRDGKKRTHIKMQNKVKALELLAKRAGLI